MKAALAVVVLVWAAQEPAVDAFVSLEPRRVEVGEPATITLVASHEAGRDVRVGELALDDTWVLLETHAPVALPDPDDDGRAVTRASWVVASLEPGRRALPEIDVELGEARAPRRAAVAVPELEVAGALAEGEDAPRPPRGFREVGPLPEPASPVPWLSGLGALVVGLAALAVVRRRRRAPRAAPAPTPLERLAELERAPLASADDVRAVHFALTRLAREAVDARAHRERAGLTDDEWLAAARGDVPAERRPELERLLAAAAEVKYGGGAPTEWAVRELLQDARRVLESLADPGARPRGQRAAPVGAAALLVFAQEPSRSTAEAGLELWGDYALADPLFLLLVPAALFFFAHGRGRRGRAAARAPVPSLARVPRSWPQRAGWLPGLLQLAAVALVATALARPLRGDVLRTSVSEGVDIALVVDRSSSMQQRDLDPARTRLDVVKEVVGQFAVRRMTDRIGAQDSVALFSFARFPELLCPFTLDSAALLGFLDELQLVRYEDEDGTGVGRALAKAVGVLRRSDADSKVVVLLTDGENNLQDITPLDAAQLAAEEGIRVYTVLAGRLAMRDVFGRAIEIDSRELEAVAQVTGGRFFRARDAAALERTYAEIESLERTPRREQRFTENHDLYPLLLLPALVLYAVAWLSHATWARRVP